MCVLSQVVDQCGCIYAVFDDLNFRDSQHELDFCDKTQLQKCFAGNFKETFDRLTCNCRPACEETIFDKTISGSLWPSTVAWVFKALEHDMTYEGNDISFASLADPNYFRLASDQVRGDMVQLQVHFTTAQSTLIAEEKVYENPFALMSTLGGAMSIWMGVSFIMIVEAVELALDGSIILFNKLKKS